MFHNNTYLNGANNFDSDLQKLHCIIIISTTFIPIPGSN